MTKQDSNHQTIIITLFVIIILLLIIEFILIYDLTFIKAKMKLLAENQDQLAKGLTGNTHIVKIATWGESSIK